MQASRTAQYMALFRALESSRRGDRLFDDPLASRFLPLGLRAAAGAARAGPLHRPIERYIDRRWPGARTSAIARTRLIDDWLRAAVRDGAEQVLILGAGFDTRAFRLDCLNGLPVYEVDRPATLAAKERALGGMGGERGDVERVAADFSRGGLAQDLAGAGFDSSVSTCTIWEGVAHYLDGEAVHETLELVASCTPPGSRLLWTYVHRGAIDGSHEFDGLEPVRGAVTRAGEPWVFGLTADEVPEYLSARRLRLLEDVGSVEYRRRYLHSDSDQRGYAFYRAAIAETTGGRDSS